MIEFWNVVFAAVFGFGLGMVVHSAWLHSFHPMPKGRLRKGIRGLLDWILELEEALLGEGIPEHWKKIDYIFVAEALINAFPFAKKFYIPDRDLWVCPKQDIVDFLAQDPTDKEKYLSESFDCDDFAWRLMGQFSKMPWSALAFGTSWSGTHAYNVVIIDENGQVWVIEPQTDELINPKEKREHYETELVFM